jgi:anthranilate synthase/aminodeoxychorismate synthase-like glutamine amidotransferase
MILVIDNYDSFTYNLVQYLGELGAVVEVHRNDQLDVEGVVARDPEGILISPGPGTPNEAGITLSVIRQLAGRYPIFGVCLGHQAIGQVYGGSVVRAPRLMHGRTSPIEHNGQGVFAGLPSPFIATRYHSLIVQRDTIGSELEVTAWTQTGEVMGLRHKTLEVEGVQFHPESFLTEHGHAMLQTFLNRTPEQGRRLARVAA